MAERPQNKHLVPYQPGQSGNPAGRPKNTPLVTPAMRRMAALPIEDMRHVLSEMEATGHVPAGFTVAEAIALTLLNDSLKTGAFTTGAKSRDTVIERLDGKAASVEVGVDIAVGIRLRFHDGSPAG